MFQFIQKLLANSVKEHTHIFIKYNILYYNIYYSHQDDFLPGTYKMNWKFRNWKVLVLNFLNKFTIHQTQGCTFKHKSIYPLSHQGLERTGNFFFLVPVVLFCKSRLLLGRHVSRYLASRFFMFPCKREYVR